MIPVVAVAVPLIGGIVIVLALIGLFVWYRSYRVRDETPPPELAEGAPPPPPPEERDETWDPRRRYDT
jgi:hypothetical protein